MATLGRGSTGAASGESTASRTEQIVAEEHELRAREQTDSSDTAAARARRGPLAALASILRA